MTPLCNFSHPANLSAESKGVPGVQQTKVHSASSDEVFNQLSTHVAACTAASVCCIKSISDHIRLRCLCFLSQSYRGRQCLKSSNLCTTRTPTAFLPLAQADPLAPAQGPLTLQLIMALAPGPWVARKRRRMRGAAETRRGEKGKQLDKVKNIFVKTLNTCLRGPSRLSRRSILPWTFCSSASIWGEGERDEGSGSAHETGCFPGPLVAGPHVP